MTIVESTRQAIGGMQHIERAIIEQVRARNGEITAANFRWNNGAPFVPLPPDVIPMHVRLGSRQARVAWSRTQIEDSWERLDRWEVRQEIERVVNELVPKKSAS
jgi:hypothetical protein